MITEARWALDSFFWGATAMGSWVVGLYFLRFWRETHDRLFSLFAAAFWVLSIDWVALAIYHPTKALRPYFYVPRLIAFLLIAIAIIDKNRKTAKT